MAEDDIWGGAVSRLAKRRANANVLEDRDPAQARKAGNLGRELGLPAATIEADLPGFQNEVNARRTRTALEAFPGLAAYTADPDNAAVAKDDLPTLGAISKIFHGDSERPDFLRRMRGSTAMPFTLGQRADAKQMFPGRVGTRVPAAPRTGRPATVGNVGRGLVAGFVGGLSKVGRMALGNAADEFGLRDRLLASDFYKGMKEEGEALDDIADVRYDPLGSVGGLSVNPGQWAYSAATSGIQMATTMPFGGKVALGALGALSGADAQQRLEARGAGVVESNVVGLATGAIEIATEKASLGFLFDNFGKKGVTSLMKGFLLRELPGELAATVGQNFVDAVSTGGVGFEEYKKNLPQDLLDTAGAVAFLGAGVGSLNAAARKLSPQVRALDDIEQSAQGAAIVDHIMEQASKSKLKGEAPETFKEFVDHAIDSSGTPVRDLYIPVEAINELMQSEGYEPETLAPYAEQIAEAQATQGDVVIPLADAAAFLGGTPAWEALKESARLQPGGVSLKEGREQHAEIMATLEQRGTEIAAEAAAEGEAKTAAAEVYTDVKNRLLSGGVSSTEAEQVAQVVAARYETRAGKLGITPTEAWQQSGVKFDWEQEGAVKGRVVKQPASMQAASPVEREDIASFVAAQIKDGDLAQVENQLFGNGGLGLGVEQRAVPIASIETGKQTSQKVVEDYAAQPAGGPRILVEKVDGKWKLIEGGHRLAAAKARGDKTILALDMTGMRGDWAAWLDGDDAAVPGAKVLEQSAAATLEPLAGMPTNIKVNGETVKFGPHAPARAAAAAIAKAAGIEHSPPATYARVDVERATRIAAEFEAMAHNPNAPETKAAYKAMIDETVAQYKELMKTGLKVEFIEGADPYGNPRNAIRDVVENNHLWVYPTDTGFGSSGADVSGNPLLKTVKGIKISGKPVRANDVFRVVHDYFGHIMEGVGFRADGEENAWRIHSAMYSPLARRAMTTETRGQNSWVNFGPNGETNRTAGPGDTIYADQKIGLLPEWVSEEGASDDRTLDQLAAIGGYEGLANFLTDDEKAKLRDKMKAKILAITESLPDAEEMAAVALAGRAKRGWYENSALAILEVFGPADAPRFAALLAALSPQTSVESNLYNALQTWTNWNEAGRPTDRKGIVEVMGASVQGGKGVGSILNAWINNSVTALSAENPAQIVLSGPKVDSFMNNLVGVVDEVTNDAWMSNYAAVDPALLAGVAKKGVKLKGPGYKAMNAVVRAAADILTNKTGELWTPAEVQETVWSFAKTVYEARDKAGQTKDMRALLAAGYVRHGDIANTPDFAVLFGDGIYRTILEEGGYGDATQSLGRNRRVVGVDGQESITALPEGSGFTQDAFDQFLGQAADRLESVRAKRRGQAEGAQRTLFQDVLPEAGWTPERISGLIDNVGREDGSSSAIAVMMSPDEYLGLLASARGRELIDGQIVGPEYGDGDLDIEELRKSSPIFMAVRMPYEPSAWQKERGVQIPGMVNNHGGRHRMALLKRAGVTRVPVVVYLEDPRGNKLLVSEPFDTGEFIGNRSRSDQTANGDRTGDIKGGIPISWKYQDQLSAMGDRILFQEPTPIFYSALARAVAESKTAKASGQQWAATLRKTPGVRQEELEWTGLLDFLTSTEGAITRDQLTALLEEGGVQVEEVVLGGPNGWAAQGWKVEEREGEWFSIAPDGTEYASDSQTDAEEFAFERTEANNPQFKSWSSDPSNDSYRELLITLPPSLAGNPTRAPSTHWDTEGVVAHARFMDKTDADGKRVLFIEEVQSDWHQKGRDQGYEVQRSDEEQARLQAAYDKADADYNIASEALKNKMEPLLQEWRANTKDSYGQAKFDNEYRAYERSERPLSSRVASLTDLLGYTGVRRQVEEEQRAKDQASLRVTETLQQLNGTGNSTKIPNAPFKSTWPALVMKRMIRYAAENGYERIAWTTGKEQSERYNLGQAVGDIVAFKAGDDSYALRFNGGSVHDTLISNGLAVDDGEGRTLMTAAQMKEAFGGDVATQIVERSPNEKYVKLDGSDLNVGGEGMRAFYDRNLVNITNDIIKKHGAKVGSVPLVGKDTPRERAVRDLLAQARLTSPMGLHGVTSRAEAQERLDTYSDMAATGLGNSAKAAQWAAEIEKAMPLYDQIDALQAEPVPSDPHPGFDLTDSLKTAALAGQPLFQNKAQPRGSVTFLKDGGKLISLFGTANRSTLLHEFSHVWLEEIRADALSPNATEQDKADWAALKKWWKQLGHAVGDSGPIPTAPHEFFARGGERYFMEGRAPRAELEGPFKAFRAWMLKIYQVVTNLQAPITPEVREVFDRLLATQEAIDAYRAQEKVEPLFKSAEEANMTEAEFAAYERSVAEARDEAYNVLLYKTMEAIRRKRTAEGREQRANVRSDVAAEVNSRPEIVALHLLRTGRWLGDPNRERQDVKLNTGWLIDTFGEDILDKLPKGLPITRGDGLVGDEVAEIVGAQSGQALVQALVGMRVASEALRASGETRSLRDKLIDDEVDRVMAERNGDVLEDGSIEEEAIAALNTARQGEIIAGEIRQLGKRASTVTAQTPYQFARAWAKRTVLKGFVRDVASRAAVQRHVRATTKAARAAEKAILEGNVDEAYRQKQAQLLNHALLAESKAAADEVDTIVKRLKKLADRAAMKSVDQDYMDKVHMLLENFDFRPRSLRSIDEQEGFQKWAEAQRDKGFEVHIPPRLENQGTPYQKVTVEELMSLNDVVASLMHLGKTKQKLKVAQGERDFAEFIDEVVTRVEQLPQRKLPDTPINEDPRIGASAAADLLKVEVIVEELDGGKTGPLHDAIVLGATNAENKRTALRDKVMAPIVEAYHKIGRKHWKRLQEKVTIPELTWNTVNEGDPRIGQPVTMTRAELLSVALNMGNLSNLEKMSKGERWPVETLRTVVQRELSKEDWDFVQLLWTQVNSLWPDIVAVERELSGVVPEQVVSSPIETRFGTYEGGYWPVVYDGARWQRAEDLEGMRADDMFGIKSGVATQKGHTITRTEAFGPISFSLENVLFQHLEQAVTRIAFSAYARDMLRIVRNDRVRGIIDTRLGSEYRKQFEPWLARQIQEGAVHAKAARWWQKLLRQARINMTIAAMGLRFSTGVAQTLGLTASANRIGARYVGTGLKRLATNPREMTKFVFDRSPEMLNRNGAVNREVSEVFTKLKGKHSMLTEAQAWSMWHIGMIDRYMVSLPTWLGAHAKGTAEGMTDVEASAYADKEVRLSQGAGGEKDLSAIQSPNNDAMRFFTMFYTPFNVMFNMQWQGVRGLKKGQIAPLAGVTFWWMMVSMLGDALLGGDWPEWEDEESVATWFGRNVFFGMFAGIPLARDYANYKERQLAGQFAGDPGQNPVQRIYDAVDKTFKMGNKYFAEGEAPQAPIRQIADVTAVLTGTPLSQPGTTGQFLWDYSQGEQDPQSISDWYYGITKGKVPEDKAE